MNKKYSENEKKSIVEEFLTIYKENPKLTARKFGINKLGATNSLFHKWVKQYDINCVYKPINNHDRRGKASKASKATSFVAITKNPVIINQPVTITKSVTINTDAMKISIPVNCSKEEFINILSAIKEIN